MLVFARRLAAVLVAAFALPFALPATAAAPEYGSLAWSLKPLVLREGPGNAYHLTGEISGKARIRVDRCTRRWCQVHAEGQKGWTSIDHIGFGQEPRYPFTGPRLGYKRGGPGTVCFYEGRNQTGPAFCTGSGTVVPDLLLYGKDNAYASIGIAGNVSVIACRDRQFTSYCRVYTRDANFEGFMKGNLTSFRVY